MIPTSHLNDAARRYAPEEGLPAITFLSFVHRTSTIVLTSLPHACQLRQGPEMTCASATGFRLGQGGTPADGGSIPSFCRGSAAASRARAVVFEGTRRMGLEPHG